MKTNMKYDIMVFCKVFWDGQIYFDLFCKVFWDGQIYFDSVDDYSVAGRNICQF